MPRGRSTRSPREPDDGRPGDHEAAARPARARGDGLASCCTRSPSSCPPKTTATVSFAAVSRANTLWLGLRVAGEDGDEAAYGAVEVELGNGHAVQHRPRRAEREGRRRGAAARRQPDRHRVRQRRDLLRVAVWGQPLAGRPAAQLERERRAGQRARAVRSARASDGAIWAATSAGAGALRRQGLAAARATTELASRGPRHRRQGPALGRDQQGAAPASGEAAAGVDPAAAPVILAGEMRDVATDRFGRVWAMSTTSIALVEKITQKRARSLWTGAPQK